MTPSTPTAPRRAKRSRAARAALFGASVAVLAACEEQRDLTFFENVEQCRATAVSLAKFAPEDCDRAFATAMTEHATEAPRYDSLALCEAQHGPGVCGRPEQTGGAPDAVAASAPASRVADDAAATEATGQTETQTAGGGSSFMPFLMGYMMGNMLSGATGSAYAGRPLYRDARGGMFTSDGRAQNFAGPGSTLRASPSVLTPRTGVAPKAPMTRAMVAERGGFGAARTAASGGGRSATLGG